MILIFILCQQSVFSTWRLTIILLLIIFFIVIRPLYKRGILTFSMAVYLSFIIFIILFIFVGFFLYPLQTYNNLTFFDLFKLRNITVMRKLFWFSDSTHSNLVQELHCVEYNDQFYIHVHDLLISFSDIDRLIPRPLFYKMVRLCYHLAYFRRSADFLPSSKVAYDNYNSQLQDVLQEIYTIINSTGGISSIYSSKFT